MRNDAQRTQSVRGVDGMNENFIDTGHGRCGRKLKAFIFGSNTLSTILRGKKLFHFNLHPIIKSIA